jgi:hypothetical protein
MDLAPMNDEDGEMNGGGGHQECAEHQCETAGYSTNCDKWKR